MPPTIDSIRLQRDGHAAVPQVHHRSRLDDWLWMLR